MTMLDFHVFYGWRHGSSMVFCRQKDFYWQYVAKDSLETSRSPFCLQKDFYWQYVAKDLLETSRSPFGASILWRMNSFFSGRNNHPAPARQTTRFFFSGRNNDRAPARQTTRTFFFSVVIAIAHPPDRRLELFFSGHNIDCAPARQTTRTFFFWS